MKEQGFSRHLDDSDKERARKKREARKMRSLEERENKGREKQRLDRRRAEVEHAQQMRKMGSKAIERFVRKTGLDKYISLMSKKVHGRDLSRREVPPQYKYNTSSIREYRFFVLNHRFSAHEPRVTQGITSSHYKVEVNYDIDYHGEVTIKCDGEDPDQIEIGLHYGGVGHHRSGFLGLSREPNKSSLGNYELREFGTTIALDSRSISVEQMLEQIQEELVNMYEAIRDHRERIRR